MAKEDIESAFRLLPIHPDDFELLGVKFEGKYYVDKCLPMGVRCAPAYFETFSTFLEYCARRQSQCRSLQETGPNGSGTPYSSSSRDMADLAQEAHRLLGQALAEGSHRAYQRAVNAFQEFRKDHHLDLSWPAPTTQIISFIAFLSIRGKATSTISLHVAALSYMHKMHGWADPTDHFVIKKLQEGSRRDKKKGDDRRPITQDLLKRMIPIVRLVCKSQYEAIMFRAAFLLAFFGFLRVGEFTAQQKHEITDKALIRDDIQITQTPGQFMLVRIRHSKTDQYGQATTLRIGENENKEICPVSNMTAFLQLRPPMKGPLFCHTSGSPLTRYQFSAVLRKVLTCIGANPSHYGTHSFRIEAATTAAMEGVPGEQIMAMGRWRTDVYRRYIR
ncbi:integrase/recombinase xerD homolog [Diadema setosum]|uniref:integrase/recombinase xerD homolog n=1 Tax=Diadema setosum TaxID=31175 RepID=UPI003B3B1959